MATVQEAKNHFPIHPDMIRRQMTQECAQERLLLQTEHVSEFSVKQAAV